MSLYRVKDGKSYLVKNEDDYNWWERNRYNPWDTDESIWRNTNMIWIAGIAPFILGFPAALIFNWLVCR